MLKAPMRPGVIVAGLVAVLVFDLVVGVLLGAVLGPALFAHRAPTPSTRTPQPLPALTTVTIPQGQDLFEPFILAVLPNTPVTWQNNDTVTLTVTTAPVQ